MEQIFASLLAELQGELIGLIGGVIFLGSWVLQAWESRQAGTPVVSAWFFALRAFACALLTWEAYRAGSLSILIVVAGTGVLMVYNLRLALTGRRPSN